VGFVLGAILSPPDALAPLAIARRMQVTKSFANSSALIEIL
jgi:NhaP-type Na+/H+ or K+/H+ antiporter